MLKAHLHLEWIYEEPTVDQEERGATEQESLLPPPQQELASLDEYVKIGDITNLRKQITQLEALDPKFALFTAKVSDLAEKICLDEIQTLIESYLDKPE